MDCLHRSLILPLAIPLVLGLACTRDNPAFETGGSDDVADEASAGESETHGTSDTEDPVCEFDEGQPLTITVAQNCGENEETPTRYDRWFSISAVEGDRWRVVPCLEGCGDTCESDGIPNYFSVAPFNLGELAGEQQCIHAYALRSVSDPNSCEYDALALWRYGEARPLLVAANGPLRIDEAMAASIGADIGVEPLDGCSCEALAEGCCPPEESPGQWVFTIAGDEFQVGDVTTFDNLGYELHALQAHNPSGCEGDLRAAWALVRID